MSDQRTQQARGAASYLGLFLATAVVGVVVRQVGGWVGLTKESLGMSIVFGLGLAVFLVLFEITLDAWRRRRDGAS